MADRDLTGVLLVGGASRRFGSPKALAHFEDEMLAVRAHRLLAAVCGEVLVLGKAADRLQLPFPVVDDGSPVRASIVGIAAALARARTDLCLVLPTDMPLVTEELLRSLAAACEGVDAAAPQTGPLPGAYRRSALPVLERRIAAGDLALYRALDELAVRVVECDEALLANVNEPADLTATEAARLRA